MTEFLYHTFVYNHNSGDKSISFNRIKRSLSNSIHEFETGSKNIDPFYELLKTGIIDKIGNNNYGLSPTTIIINKGNNIALGVNLPNQIILKNSASITKRFLGLIIFKEENLICDDYDINLIYFNIDKFISQMHSINSIVQSWNTISLKDVGQINQIQKYNALKNSWETEKEIQENNKLYRVYLYESNFYKYLFFYKNKYYSIETFEFEKVNTLKLINCNKSLFKYDKESEILKLKSYYPYPNYLYKFLLLNHILKIGEFPSNNQFKIEFKVISRIFKILKLNHKLE